MLGRRPKPPVLARVPRRDGAEAAGTLNRSELEAFGSLLERLGEARVVLLTGAADASAAALGLATSAVAAGRGAVLVECRLGDPGLAARLGLAPIPGLGEYLRHEAEAPQILRPLALAGPATAGVSEPLVCVVGGTPSGRGAGLLASEEFRHAVGRLREAYELVVLDGPPLADRQSLAAAVHADLTIGCEAQGPARELRDLLDGRIVTEPGSG